MTNIGNVFARTQEGLGLLVPIDVARPLDELTAALNALCDEVEAGGDKTTVVLRISGTSACREWPGDVTIQSVNRWERAIRRLERLPVVNIAVAQGPCSGPALDLLLAADYRIASPDLQIILPINDGHFWPGMSVYRLVQHLGVARARQIVMWGVSVSLARASELGIIDQVSENLDDAVHTATVLSGRVSDREITVRRQLLLEAPSAEFDEAFGLHLAACDRELRRLRGAANGPDASAAS